MTHAMEDESWDIVRDLHFLIASDDQLQDDLAHVCDLLTGVDGDDGGPSVDVADKTTSEESDASSTPTKHHPPTPPLVLGKRQTKRKVGTAVRFETRQKDEILSLQAQVKELKAQLAQRQSKDSLVFMSTGVSAWEKAARRELAEKNKSLRENEQLRSAVTEQATFIEHMQTIFAKKPRLSTMDNEISLNTWQEYKLAAQASLREAAIHAIADRQFARQQNAFIVAGLFERADVLFQAGPRTLPDGSNVLEFIYHLTLPAPYDVVGHACWQVYNGERPPTMADGAKRALEILDKRTVYMKYTEQLGSTTETSHVNVIHKQYIEPDRHVIVWRAVLEDALMPTMATGNVQNEWGWIVISPVPEDLAQCRLTLLGQVPQKLCGPDMICPYGGDKLEENITAFVDKLSIGESVVRPPPPPKDVEGDAGVQFMNRGKRLELALQLSINDAVVAYRAKQAAQS